MVQVLQRAADKKELINAALNTHGTRAVQKLIETLNTPEQVNMYASSQQNRLGQLSHAY